MSIASLIHEHSYSYQRQIQDGTLRSEVNRDGPESSSNAAKRSTRKRQRRRRAETERADDNNNTVTATSWTPPSAASYYIPSLPGLDSASTLTLFGGHIPSTITANGPVDTDVDASTPSTGVDNGNAHLFFFLAKAKHIAEKEKLVLWLNGGPGCSSFDGALMEIGPLRMAEGKKGKEVIEQEGAWNEYANVLFLDQPAGTGYSYVENSKYVHSGQQAAAQIVTFLQNFYSVFPEYERMDLYVAGESFAGIWIPYLADALLTSKQVNVNLRGLLIGNGWIDPYNQYPAYLDFAYSSKLLTPDTNAAKNVERAVAACEVERKRIGKDDFPINNGMCEGILSSITETTLQVVNGVTYCVNNYDIRLTDTHPACGMNWPNLLPDMYDYLPRPDVVSAFHASSKTSKWVECNGHVSSSFWPRTKPSVQLLPSLLERNVPILLFSGMQDLICNHVGTERLIENLEWAGGKGFGNGTEKRDWFVDGRLAGTWTVDRNLTYVQVHNASHMVPFDLPIVAHDMLSRFLSTDYISAAGAAALVPSRIGNEEASIVGETHVNGTALDSSNPLSSDSDSLLSDSTSIEESAKSPVADAYYNIGAALLVLLIVVAFGSCFIYRQRKRRRSIFSKGFSLGGSSGPSDSPAGVGVPYSHRRHRSSGAHSHASAASGRKSNTADRDEHATNEETNELLPMHHKRQESNTLSHKGEELFSVGEDDEEEEAYDSEEEGNLGRAGRKFSA